MTTRAVLKAITPPIAAYTVKRLLRKLPGNHHLPPKIEGVDNPTHVRLERGEVYYSGKGVGDMWDAIGQLQFELLVQNGLQPHHRLLDIGCGSLRGGVHFVEYLDSGNYYGIDKQQWLLDAAIEVELPRYGLAHKAVHLINRDDFDFSVFGVKFDYAIAQSVFTHLTWNSILRCLFNVEQVLAEQGRLYATFFEDPKGDHYSTSIHHSPGAITTYPDKDPYHYAYDVFVELARRVRLEVKYIGNWNHPRNQMIMVFKKRWDGGDRKSA